MMDPLRSSTSSRREAQGVPTTGHYLAGCWEETPINDMAWAAGPNYDVWCIPSSNPADSSFQLPSLSPVPGQAKKNRNLDPGVIYCYIAPSWSCASVRDLASEDPHRHIRDARLVLRAKLRPSRWTRRKKFFGCR